MFPRRLIYAAIAISSAAAFVLFGYEFIRSVSSSLFIKAYGADNLMFGMALISPSMIVMLYCYGRLLSWRGRDVRFGDNLAFFWYLNPRILRRTCPWHAFRCGDHLCIPRSVYRDRH